MQFELPPAFWETVSRFSGGHWPPHGSELEAFVETARQHHLLPLLHSCGPDDAKVRSALGKYQALLHAERKRTEIMGAALEQLIGSLNRTELILLKGIDYGTRIYPSPWLRPMADIDVLVRREEYGSICQQILDLGGTRINFAGPVGMRADHHERVFLFRHVTIEIHQSFIQRSRFTIDYDGIWKRRVPSADARCSRLSDVDAFIYHAITMAIDGFNVTLIRFVDCWNLLLDADKMTEVFERGAQWSCRNALYGTLTQMTRVFPDTTRRVPPSWKKSLRSGLTSHFLDQFVLPDPFGSLIIPGRPMQLWRKFWLMDDMTHRFRFLLSHYVPSLMPGRSS